MTNSTAELGRFEGAQVPFLDCPTWCARDHSQDSMSRGNLVHVSERKVSGFEVSIGVQPLSDYQPCESEPTIFVQPDDAYAQPGMSAAEARALATALLALAELAEMSATAERDA